MKATIAFYNNNNWHERLQFTITSAQLIEELEDVFNQCGEQESDLGGTVCYLSDIYSEMDELLEALEDSVDEIKDRQEDMLEKELVLLTITQ